ncbi:MAG: orotate phosphoribosyltransferase [Elusimicrobia bacterium]|nr:orotate phosphoribosyltransferase [Elusimicrobiota bacterium]
MNGLSKFDMMGLLEEHEALMSGHFVLPSGSHTPTFMQTAVLLQYPNLAGKIAKALSLKFPQPVDVVLSPAMGAVIIGQEVARVRKVRAMFTERINGVMNLRREFKLQRGERVLVVEDVLTTGRSTTEVVNLARAADAKVIGVAAIIDRSTSFLPLKVPVRALISYPMQIYPSGQCPQCQANVPLTTPGQGSLREKPNLGL